MDRRTFIKNSCLLGFGILNPIKISSARSYDFDLILGNALLLKDKEVFRADIGIKQDKIAALGDLKENTAQRVISAESFVVTPGFIDIHAHSEEELLINPKAESKVRQGVTTEILGQDGSSIAPLSADMQAELHDSYKRSYGLDVDWYSFKGYYDRLRKGGIAVNVGMMIGQGTLREFVMGHSDRPATFAEIDKMKALAGQTLDQGALGISSGLEYTPGAFASSEELIEICKAMHFSNGIYTTHMRNEADFVLEALDEAIAVAKGADVALHISHLKSMGERNWGKVEEIFERIQAARTRGVSITFDRYPYTAYNTSLSSLFPLWSRAGGTKAFLDRLKNVDILPKIKQETLAKIEMIGSWDSVMITSVTTGKNRPILGKRISEIIGNNGTDAFDTVCKLIRDEKNGVGMCGFAMSEENTAKIISHPSCMVASDASARADYGRLSHSNPHPRTYGTFPRAIRKYVREQKILSLAEMIHKMTDLPASRLGLKGRGKIATGFFADLVVFDPETISDRATYSEPHQYPEGIEYVLVNGKIVVEKGNHTGELPGRIL